MREPARRSCCHMLCFAVAGGCSCAVCGRILEYLHLDCGIAVACTARWHVHHWCYCTVVRQLHVTI